MQLKPHSENGCIEEGPSAGSGSGYHLPTFTLPLRGQGISSSDDSEILETVKGVNSFKNSPLTATLKSTYFTQILKR